MHTEDWWGMGNAMPGTGPYHKVATVHHSAHQEVEGSEEGEKD
jgi:hypothetical protein